MPTRIDRVERGIYRTTWLGNVTLTDLHQENDELGQLADADHVDDYVLIVDASQVGSMPVSVIAMIRTLTPQMCAVLAYRPPTIGYYLGRMAKPFLTIPLEFFEDETLMLKRARTLFLQSMTHHQDPA